MKELIFKSIKTPINVINYLSFNCFLNHYSLNKTYILNEVLSSIMDIWLKINEIDEVKLLGELNKFHGCLASLINMIIQPEYFVQCIIEEKKIFFQ